MSPLAQDGAPQPQTHQFQNSQSMFPQQNQMMFAQDSSFFAMQDTDEYRSAAFMRPSPNG